MQDIAVKLHQSSPVIFIFDCFLNQQFQPLRSSAASLHLKTPGGWASLAHRPNHRDF